MNTQNFRNALALPALIAVGLLGNTASIRGQSMMLQHPVGSWLYTVTIPVDGDPADNIVFQGVETYMLGGGYIETDQHHQFVASNILGPFLQKTPSRVMDPGRARAARISF